MRKMASIQEIKEINPIENADAIEVVGVNGWQVVTKKGEHNVGDKVIFCEIDSWVPHEIAPFLSKSKEPREYLGVKGERLRTIRLRGQISQGLVLPIDTLEVPFGLEIGEDVSEQLGIVKYDPPLPAQLVGMAKGNFPDFIPKTRQERYQNIVGTKDYIEGDYQVTEKLEGTSLSCFIKDWEFGVCSRNLELKEEGDSVYWKVAREQQIEEKLRAFLKTYTMFTDIAIQGEIIGEGVQGNIYNLKGNHLYVFDVYDITNGYYLKPVTAQMATLKMGLDYVPIIPEEEMKGLTLLEAANGKSKIGSNPLREGIVCKLNDFKRATFKVISNEYLLKQK